MLLVTIKRRAHFLRVRGGARWSCASFALEARQRPAEPGVPGQADLPRSRFGFTVTKKLGNAVVRNRIKRRLREAVRHSASPHSQPTYDYVLIAREAALKRRFAELQNDLQTALQRVHAKGGAKTVPKAATGGPSQLPQSEVGQSSTTKSLPAKSPHAVGQAVRNRPGTPSSD